MAAAATTALALTALSACQDNGDDTTPAVNGKSVVAGVEITTDQALRDKLLGQIKKAGKVRVATFPIRPSRCS
ncbi:hypothetical protein [Streptomyces sp. SLBN-31]|uniref:hypothetical protein n=1 Tax=Streptomyces sp. SLBN-31 TaxID=2768444 RepID=UPI001171E560|nr:hypothetical protein [Streptomyces sp. SLBN-31]TQJ85358.1 hypothetical protein FBY22_4128 [Streptomyces sp. SLBN-31]